MSKSTIKTIEKLYDSMQRRFHVEPGSPELSEATQFYTNRLRPVHRWFHFKEGFAANLLDAAGINSSRLADEDSIFVDPFCGSGTTLLAGDIQYKWRARRIGLEINPFLSFVADTKTNWRQYNPAHLSSLAAEILEEPLEQYLSQDKWPQLSSLDNPDMFNPRRVSALVDLVERIRCIDAPERDLLMLGVAAATESLSYYRKDGRALRILRSPTNLKKRKRNTVIPTLKRIWATYESDLRVLQQECSQARGRCMVLRRDGRSIRTDEDMEVEPGQVTLMAYSPPYLNHIDYTEVYKVELWLLGFVSSQEEMRKLRKQTLRSHASTTFTADGAGLSPNVKDAIEIAASAIEDTGTAWHKRFRDTAFGYLQDMSQSLSRQYELLRPGSQAVCVVANSAHGSTTHRIPIATDLFIAAIARRIGFEIQHLLVARQMRRRDSLNRYLRETVIVLRRPSTT